MNELKKISTGELIPFQSASLSTDDNSFVWTANFELPDQATFDKLKPAKSLQGDTVAVSFKLGLETWQLFIENANNNYNGNAFSVSGRSLAILLAEPYSLPVTHTWINTSAQAIIQDLCEAAGVSLQFLINDWAIDEFIATERYPIDIITELAAEKKAAIQSTPSGILQIISSIPCSPNKLIDYAPDYSLATDTNLFTRPYEFKNYKNYNALFITKETTGTAGNAPSVSFEEELDGDQRLIKVLVNPFVEDINLSHASGDNVTVHYEGIRYRTITDQLIVQDGKAQLSKPYHELLSVQWQQDNLGEVVINRRGEVAVEAGFSLADITYSSPYHQYRFINMTDIDYTAIQVLEISAPIELGALSCDVVIGNGDHAMPPIVVKTLSSLPDLIERAQAELWPQLYDSNVYNIERDYQNVPMLPCYVALVVIRNDNDLFKGYVKSVSIKIDSTITQQVTIERPLL